MHTAHRKDSIGHHDSPPTSLCGVAEGFIELGEIEVAVDEFFAGTGQANRVDDTVMVKFIADDGRFRGGQRGNHTQHRRICACKEHRSRTMVECSQLCFQRDVRL